MDGVTIEIKPAAEETPGAEANAESTAPVQATVEDVAAVAVAAGAADGAIAEQLEEHREETQESIEWLKSENVRLSQLTMQLQGQVQTLTEIQAKPEPPSLTLPASTLETETITAENPEASAPTEKDADGPLAAEEKPEPPAPEIPKRKFRLL